MCSLTQIGWNPDSRWAVWSRQTCLKSCKINTCLKSECRTLTVGSYWLLPLPTRGNVALLAVVKNILPLLCNQSPAMPCNCGNQHPECEEVPCPVQGDAELCLSLCTPGTASLGVMAWVGETKGVDGCPAESLGKPKSWFAYKKITSKEVKSSQCAMRGSLGAQLPLLAEQGFLGALSWVTISLL